MENLKQFLTQFNPVSDEVLDDFLRSGKHKSFKKGEVLLAPGEVQKELYFVLEGVQMSYTDFGEKLYVIAFTYAPGLCAVPESFLFQAPSPCYLTCLSDTKMLAISYDTLQAFFDQSPSLERLFRRMDEMILSGFIKRHLELHALTMEQRFRAFCERSPHLLHTVPHKYIASYLGIDPTNFSKLFNSVKI